MLLGERKRKRALPARFLFFDHCYFYWDTRREFWINRETFAFSDCTGDTREKLVAFCDRFATDKPVTVSWESLKKEIPGNELNSSQCHLVNIISPFISPFIRNKTGWWKLERRRKSGNILQWQLGNCL